VKEDDEKEDDKKEEDMTPPYLTNKAGGRVVTSGLRTSKSTWTMSHGRSTYKRLLQNVPNGAREYKNLRMKIAKLWTGSCRTRLRAKCWRLSNKTRAMTTVPDL